MKNNPKLPPQCFLLPSLWKSKSTRKYIRILGEKAVDVLLQVIGWVNDVQEIADNGKNEIQMLGTCRLLVDKGIVRTAWHQWTNTQSSVPKSCMMGTDVSNINQCVEPRGKDCVADSECSCDITFGMTRLQILVGAARFVQGVEGVA